MSVNHLGGGKWVLKITKDSTRKTRSRGKEGNTTSQVMREEMLTL